MVSVIIAAAGASSRMGGLNKQLEKIGDTPVFVMSALKFDKLPRVSEIIIAAPPDDVPRFEKLARNYGVSKLVGVTPGGNSRYLSIRSALEIVSPKSEFIAIHDGARPLIEPEDIERVFDDAEKYDAAIAAAPAVDTVKSVGSNGFIEGTIPRAGLYVAQTPQVFRKKLYMEWLGKIGLQAENLTDDSGIAEECGQYVKITEILSPNFKITRPDDLIAANAIYDNRRVVKKI